MGESDAGEFIDRMIEYMEQGWSEKQAYEQFCQDSNI
jgi:hypothetical protein